VLAVLDAVVARALKPLLGLGVVGRPIDALAHQDGEVVHGADIALVGGALVPGDSAREVLLHALAPFQAAAKPVLGDGNAPRGGTCVPVRCGREVLAGAAAFGVTGGYFEGGGGIAGSRSLLELVRSDGAGDRRLVRIRSGRRGGICRGRQRRRLG